MFYTFPKVMNICSNLLTNDKENFDVFKVKNMLKDTDEDTLSKDEEMVLEVIFWIILVLYIFLFFYAISRATEINKKLDNDVLKILNYFLVVADPVIYSLVLGIIV